MDKEDRKDRNALPMNAEGRYILETEIAAITSLVKESGQSQRYM